MLFTNTRNDLTILFVVLYPLNNIVNIGLARFSNTLLNEIRFFCNLKSKKKTCVVLKNYIYSITDKETKTI